MSQLATQGIQNLFSLYQSGPQSGPHWEANSESLVFTEVDKGG